MKTDFLQYYGEHNISPVRQDISDIELHYERRKKLYRQCGIPTITFKNVEILEVGPGGGYNTLAFFHWDIEHIDLVEANPAGREDMQRLFLEYDIPVNRYNIFPCKIEDFQTEKKYDMIIAEGFLPNIYNQQEVINKLKSLATKNGIVVITCSDDVSYFVEIMKRLVGVSLTGNMTEYNQKVEYLTNFFSPQLSKLKGVSRSPKDWVQDQILNPVVVNGTELTMARAITYFGDEFDVLATSPRMFTDYSWYKDVWYDYKKSYKEQFNRKRMSLLMANMPEIILSSEQAGILVKYFEHIKKLESEYEETRNLEKVGKIIEEMDSMDELLQKDFCDEFVSVFHEIKEVLLCILRKEDIHMEKYPHFFSAFGRTMQYMSFVKK